ncbi:hypothetical protein A3715_11425 [Oleiphilus sp. HI0009]|nr:hypothetical protein A3715_11425 [Oleiphilus sp. HI0009]
MISVSKKENILFLNINTYERPFWGVVHGFVGVLFILSVLPIGFYLGIETESAKRFGMFAIMTGGFFVACGALLIQGSYAKLDKAKELNK